MPHRFKAPEVEGMEEFNRLVNLLDERRYDEVQIRGRVLLESAQADQLVRTRVHNLLCWNYVEGLKVVAPEAALHGEEAARLAERLGDRSLLAQILCNLASSRYQLGDYLAAREAYLRLVGLLETEPGLLPCGLIIAGQGLAHLDQVEGRLAESLQRLEETIAQCEAEGSPSLLAETRRRLTLVLVKMNQPEEAAAMLESVDEAAFSVGPRSQWWKTHLWFTRARVTLALGHWNVARPLIMTTLALARELGDLPVTAEAVCLLALVDQAEGRKESYRRARLSLTYAISSGRRDVVADVRERLMELLDHEL
jgi:tetratricopeptide (TPR) repeat protein